MISPLRELRAAGGRGPGSGLGPRIADYTPIVLAAGFALLTGAIAVKSLQAGVTIAILVLLVAVYLQSRRAGMFGLWWIWLLTPALRRVLALSGGAPASDPLSLLPFLATGVLMLIELRRSDMNGRARGTLTIGALGFMVGAPMGLLAEPSAFLYSALAYLSGLGALVLGWADARENGRPTLIQAAIVAGPPIAIYGIAQYFLPLTSWDSLWVETVNLVSIGSPQEGHIRIFSLLNSPGTFGLVLAVVILLCLGVRRRPLAAVASNLVVVVALALTFVRSAWLAVAIGIIIFAAAARGKSAKRLVGFIAIFLVLIFGVGGSNPTTRAFTERITTLGQLGSDDSAQKRLSVTQEIPAAVSQPLGKGLGSAGQGSKLSEGSEAGEASVATDNGYLALLSELGLVGFLLVVLAMGRGIVSALRSSTHGDEATRRLRAAVLAALVALVLANAGGDILYGVTGAFFWYLIGLALANEDLDQSRGFSSADERPI